LVSWCFYTSFYTFFEKVKKPQKPCKIKDF